MRKFLLIVIGLLCGIHTAQAQCRLLSVSAVLLQAGHTLWFVGNETPVTIAEDEVYISVALTNEGPAATDEWEIAVYFSGTLTPPPDRYLSSYQADPGFLALHDALSNPPLAQIPYTQTNNTFDMHVPLAVLGAETFLIRANIYATGQALSTTAIDATCDGKRVTTLGTANHDIIYVNIAHVVEDPVTITYSSLVTMGLGGNDSIYGSLAGDIICGGEGNDYLNGGPGDDRIFGEGGHDTIQGGVGNDYLNGGPGNDNMTGDSGADTMIGGTGNDLCDGGIGTDTANGDCELKIAIP